MVDGSVVADPCLDKDAECLAAWRWVLSEFEEETLSCLIQTGESFSSNLKTAIIEVFFSKRPPVQYLFFSKRFSYVRLGSLASDL